ncbi:DNA phosphorothioation system sulfurtransferase DndC [Bacteroides xylanisolvens]|jgi:DNA sulfur modification protein DndC|uniref:DNA phosphorothioation system sulfurtransferase DndC n=1 Tax=Bacteroides TaxID=816 RepID=UPI001C252ECD|nr:MULTISPECIES: DNA phosphorothioation system sulfurtransferase DndC [Bacteroides]MBU9951265.1 DNA phosphorothioation system sulfurtransferase DndC [Bacteroides sp. MSK.20.12]MBV3451142.1 DNA phosphorothioation system sulfurtransferase DndC [Bacteroides xylanisolvens]MBV4223777.1 DNA phosphorothioation system sulfurtransferase DndC [Bacteroides xylanisolvens]
MKNKKIENIIEELMDQYQETDRYNRSWIIGFSGGKDSTVLLTLVWIAITRLKESGIPLHRRVYVVCNDTMVENPVIEEYVTTVLQTIKKAAKEQQLPITVRTTTPQIEDTFWSCVIGKGYPVPNNAFRFCTEKMKIKPTSTFITNQVAADGEAIILIGTRLDESQQRANSIRKHEIKGHRLTKHPLNPNTYTYAPIKELMLEEVWWIINIIPSPWGFDNKILFKIYSDASADDYECPTVVTDETHRSCGQSRFGCWICTVVKEDKSMTSLIKNGVEWMKPLLDFRNRLVLNRNVSELRSDRRRNGQLAVDETGHNQGCYTMKYRIQLLRELLTIQKETQEFRSSIDLITSQELIAIQVIWYRDGNFTTTVNDIYNQVYGFDLPNDNIGLQERLMLEKACKDSSHYRLIQELLALQKNKTLLMKKYGLQTDLDNRLATFVKEEIL